MLENGAKAEGKYILSDMQASRRSMALAVTVSAAIVVAGPIMGQIRAALQAAFPAQYLLILGGVVGVGVVAAVVVAVVRIRDQRMVRAGAILLALTIGVGYSLATAVEQDAINAVERVHFIEYGIVGLLFYRVWRPAGDPSTFILPLLASLVVGTLDEWLQWFVPVRVGEARDVALNGIAVACGLLFGVAVNPPESWSRRLNDRSRARVGLAAAGAMAVFAAFFAMVHVGHVVRAEGVGEFRSHYAADELLALARDRDVRWRTDPPRVFRRYSREDQYMDEGLWHVRRRNGLWAANDFARARQENLILERFFVPVLDTATYALPSGGRWPAAQRADAEARAMSAPNTFVSDAEPYTIVVF